MLLSVRQLVFQMLRAPDKPNEWCNTHERPGTPAASVPLIPWAMQGLEGSPLEAQLLHGDGIRLEEVPGLAEAPILITGLWVSFVPVPCPHVPYLACTMHHSDCYPCSNDSTGGQMKAPSSLQAAHHRDAVSQEGASTRRPQGYM